MTAPASMEVSGGVEESKTATEPKPSAPTNVNAAMVSHSPDKSEVLDICKCKPEFLSGITFWVLAGAV